MVTVERLIIVGTDGNLYEFLHGRRNTDGWKDCFFKDSRNECQAFRCNDEVCTRIRKIFGEETVWSWRKL